MGSIQAHWHAAPRGSDVNASLQSLAAYIKTQPAFTDAGLSAGTVWATLADGQPVEFFTDRLADYSALRPAGWRVRTSQRPLQTAGRGPSATGAGHRVVYLFNDLGDPAFTPARQVAFTQAFTDAGYTNQFAVEYGSIALENISAPAPPSDYVNVAAHGGNAYNVFAGRELYTLGSTTLVTQSNYYQYLPEVRAGRLVYSSVLTDPSDSTITAISYAFTSAWLVSHMQFTPGAVFVNSSCLGANVYPAGQAFIQDLQNAGVGVYLGWTKVVSGVDADETEAYIVDRLVGGPNGLGAYVDPPQASPQRPYQVRDILSVLSSKKRTNPIRGSRGALPTVPLDTSTQQKAVDLNSALLPAADGPSAKFVATGDLASSNPVVPLVPPTIAHMTVDEAASPLPTLTIDGEFSPVAGSVAIGGSSGTYLPVISWSTQEIVAQLPLSGPQSGPVIAVETGVPSNAVPLTMWSTTYTLTKKYALSDGYSGPPGSGSFAYSATLNVDLRADVHDFTTQVDGSLSQPDFVALPMRSSTGTISGASGSWHSSAGDPVDVSFTGVGTATLTPVTTSLAANAPLGDWFSISPSAMEAPAIQAGCNRGSAFDSGDAHPGVYCTSIQAFAQRIATCSDNQNGYYCGSSGQNAPLGGGFDTAMYGTDAIGAFGLNLDPSYHLVPIIVPPTDPNANSLFYNFKANAQTTWAVTAGDPVAPPNNLTPANVRRAR